MSFEDRVRSTVDQAISSLVQQLLAQATEEREEAVRTGRAKAFEEAEVTTQTRVADADARMRVLMDEAIKTGRQRGARHRVARNARQDRSRIRAQVE